MFATFTRSNEKVIPIIVTFEIGNKTEEEEVDQLRRRLEETERAMERICRQMGDVTDKLSTSAVADLLTPQLSSDKVGIKV